MGYQVEAAGFEPASRDVFTLTSTCVVVVLNFAQFTGQRHPESSTRQELNLTESVLVVTFSDLELMTSFLSSPAEPISWGYLFLGSQCERVIFCK